MALPQRPRAVITGASSGLGRALAVELARRQADILMADIDEKGAGETARLVEQAGGRASFTSCDVRDRAAVAGLLTAADKALGGVDVLINNAGVSVGGLVGDVPLDDWAWVIDINLFGVIYGCHSFIPRFREQRGGAILNVASAAGLLSAPMLGPYNVTKAGVVALSETLRAELREHNIAVTVLCPTFFKTKIASSGRAKATPAEMAFIEDRMEKATIQADGVARYAIESLDKGRFFALPHRDGRWAWRLKRATPGLFVESVVPNAMKLRR